MYLFVYTQQMADLNYLDSLSYRVINLYNIKMIQFISKQNNYLITNSLHFWYKISQFVIVFFFLMYV